MSDERLRVLIADDEQVARRRLQRLLSAMPDIEVIGEVADGDEVLAFVKEGDVDVVLLDIEMPRLTGLEAMGLLPEGEPVIVFVTAHAAHAVTAFDGGVADYLLKPVEASRLKKALERARQRLYTRPSAAESAELKLAIPTRNGVLILGADEIRAAVIDGETVSLNTTRGVVVTDFRIGEIEKKLTSASFARVHRKALLNLDHVEQLEPLETGGYLAVLTDGNRVPISRQAARRLRRAWGL
jgi:two-component system, LytTR family, response regulator